MSVGTKHPHYYKDVRHLQTIDVYRVLHLFNVTDPLHPARGQEAAGRWWARCR